jgi:Ca2+-binding RTX toxin-like protein
LPDGTEDTNYGLNAGQLLTGFSDPDGDVLAVANLVANHGTVTDNGDGSYTVTPALNYNDAVKLSYDVIDGNGGSIAAQQSFDLAPVNDAPVVAAPVPDQSVTQGQSYAYTVPVGTFTDVDVGDTLEYSASLDDGSVLPAWLSFDATTRTFSGIVPGGFDPQSVDLRVTAVDEASLSVFDDFTLNIEHALPSSGDDVLYGSNDNDTIDALGGNDVVYGGPGHDRLFGNLGNDTLDGGDGDDLLAGQWGVDVLTGGAGVDQFNFSPSDGNGDRITDYTVGERIFIYNGIATTLSQYALHNDGVRTLLEFDSDNNGIPDLTLTLDGVYDGPLSLTRELLAGAMYEVLSIGPANGAPTGAPTATLENGSEDTLYVVSAAVLLAGFSDPDGDVLAVANLVANHGTVTDNGDGSHTVTPELNYNGAVTLSYDVIDGNGGSIGAQQTFHLAPVNDAPVTVDDRTNTTRNTAVTIDVLVNDTDVDAGDTLVLTSYTQPANGNVSLDTEVGQLIFTPRNNWTGTTTFSYTANDSRGGSATSQVTVIVTTAGLVGTDGDDTLTGTTAPNLIDGGAGNDSIDARRGDDIVYGGVGDDTVVGGSGADELHGGDGDDRFLVTSTYLGGDEMYGGDGDDTLVFTGSVTLVSGFTVSSVEKLDMGSKTLTVKTSTLVDLSAFDSTNPALIKGDGSTNAIVGTRTADTINGQGGNDNLGGSEGDDTIYGGAGADVIDGGAGNDRLYGGSSAKADKARDVFVFSTLLDQANNVDVLFGFEANGNDRIAFEPAVFSALLGGATTGLDADEFRANVGGIALDANDHILFDSATGNLYYDADGNGVGDQVQFATLASLIGVLDYSDFTVLATLGQ